MITPGRATTDRSKVIREISRACVNPSGITEKWIDSFSNGTESITGFRFRRFLKKGITEVHLPVPAQPYRRSITSPAGVALYRQGRIPTPMKKAFRIEDLSNKLFLPRQTFSRKRKERLRGESVPCRILAPCERSHTPITKMTNDE